MLGPTQCLQVTADPCFVNRADLTLGVLTTPNKTKRTKQQWDPRDLWEVVDMLITQTVVMVTAQRVCLRPNSPN